MKIKTDGFGKVMVFRSLALFGLTAFLLACSNMEDPMRPDAPHKKTGDGRGKIELSITMATGNTKTIMPPINSGAFDRYTLVFENVSGNGLTQDPLELTDRNDIDAAVNGDFSYPIMIGTWNITATADVKNAAGADGYIAAGTGSADDVVVEDGKPVIVAITIAPIEDGAGTFNWDIKFTENVKTGSLTLTKIDSDGNATGDQETVPLAGTGDTNKMELASGLWRVDLELDYESAAVASMSTVLHIYDNIVSRWDFTASPAMSLLNVALQSWNGTEWRFPDGFDLKHLLFLRDQGHFKGIPEPSDPQNPDPSEIAAILDRFTEDLTAISLAAHAPAAPYQLDDFKKLLDAALIVRANRDGRIPETAVGYQGNDGGPDDGANFVDNLIGDLVRAEGNGSDLKFDWNGRDPATGRLPARVLPVTVGGVYHIDVGIDMAYVNVDAADFYPQAGFSTLDAPTRFPVSIGYVVGESGDFAFTDDVSGTPANVLKVIGLPDGATINRDLSHFANVDGPDASAGDGELFLDVTEDTEAGKYPIRVELGSNPTFGTEFYLYVQEFTIEPNDITMDIGDYWRDPIVLNGRFVAKPGSHEVKLPPYGNDPDQMFGGLTLTATPFVVDNNNNGSSTITVTGECKYYNPNADRTTQITVADLEAQFNAHRVAPSTGEVYVNLNNNMINVVQGDKKIKIPVSGIGWGVSSPNPYWSWRWHDSATDIGFNWNPGYNVDPMVYILPDGNPDNKVPLGLSDSGITLVRNDLDDYTGHSNSEGKNNSAGLSWLESNSMTFKYSGELLLDIADTTAPTTYVLMYSFGGTLWNAWGKKDSLPFMLIVGKK